MTRTHRPDAGRHPLVVVAGVSGSGKTTVAHALARRLRVPFADADDFHPAANRAMMAAGRPLGEAERAPWLAALNGWLRQRHDTGAVLACSALRRAHRDLLRGGNPHLVVVQLAGEREVLAQHLAGRRGHFMPAELLDSQLATLEPLQPDEPGAVLDVAEPPEEVVAAAYAVVEQLTAPAADGGHQG